MRSTVERSIMGQRYRKYIMQMGDFEENWSMGEGEKGRKGEREKRREGEKERG